MDFYHACISKDTDAVRANINFMTYYEWHDGLCGACEQGHLEIVRLLLSVDLLNLLDLLKFDMKYSFYNACLGGHMEIIQFLISKFPKKIRWESGFNGACYGGHIEIVKFLIIESENENKNTIWRYYCWPRDKPEITALLYLKTPLNAFQRINGFQKLSDCIVETNKAIKMSNVMIPDLLNIVVGFIII